MNAFPPPLTPQDILKIKENPLLLVTRGYMAVNSKVSVLENGLFAEHSPRRVPFRPHFRQRQILSVTHECQKRQRPCKIVLVKCRRDGASEIASKIIASKAAFAEVPMISALGPTDKEIEQICRPMLVRALKSLPDPLAPTFAREFTTPLHFSRQSSPLFGVPSHDECEINLISAQVGSSAGIGTACYLGWITETAYLKKGEATMEGFLPTIIEGPDTFVFQESVALGKGNYHHETFSLSWEMQGRCNPGEPGFDWDSGAPEVAMFFPWFWAEDRVMQLPRGVTKEMFFADLDEYEKEIMNMRNGLLDFARRPKNRKRVFMQTDKGPVIGLPSEEDVLEYVAQQLYWRRCYAVKVREFSYHQRKTPLKPGKTGPTTKVSLLRTIPATVDEAFVGDEVLAFADAVIGQHQANLREPVVGIIHDDGRFEECGDGWCKVWFAPSSFTGPAYATETRRILKENNWMAPREVFVTAADFAAGDYAGDEKADLSAVTAWNFRRQQVLEVNVREPVPKFENKLHRIRKFLSGGHIYRTPFEIPESSNMGRRYAQAIADSQHPDFADHQGRLFFSKRIGNLSNPDFTDKPGFEASIHKMAQVAWTTFTDVILNVNCEIRSRALLAQIASLARNANDVLQARNKGQAGEGSKDDIADTAKMAFYYIDTLMTDYGSVKAAFGFPVDDYGNILHRADDEYDPNSPEGRAMREAGQFNLFQKQWFQTRADWREFLKDNGGY